MTPQQLLGTAILGLSARERSVQLDLASRASEHYDYINWCLNEAPGDKRECEGCFGVEGVNGECSSVSVNVLTNQGGEPIDNQDEYFQYSYLSDYGLSIPGVEQVFEVYDSLECDVSLLNRVAKRYAEKILAGQYHNMSLKLVYSRSVKTGLFLQPKKKKR